MTRRSCAFLVAIGASIFVSPHTPAQTQSQPRAQAQVQALAQSQAQFALDAWRREVAAAHVLVTNSIPQAYAEAERLLTELPSGATAADRVSVLNVLTRAEIYLAMPAQAGAHARQAIDLARSQGDLVGEIEAQLNVAATFANGSIGLESPEIAASRSMALLDGVDRPDLLGEALLQTALMYLNGGHFDESVTTSMQALEIARRNNNPLALVYAHESLTMALVQSGRAAEALQHAVDMVEISHHTNSKLLEAQATFALGSLYQLSGNSRAAEPLLHDSLAAFQAIGARYIEGRAMLGLADVYRAEGRTDEAFTLLGAAEALYSSYSSQMGLWNVLSARSDLELYLNRLAPALADARRAYELCAASPGLQRSRSDSARRLAAVLDATGDVQRAYSYLAEAMTLTNQAARERANARLAEVTQRYESESRQREVTELVHRNELQTAELKERALTQRWLWTMLAAAVVMLAGAGYFLLRLRQSHRALGNAYAELQRSRDHIEQRKAAEAARETALAEAERLARTRSEFLAQMSHELRTPLNGILGFAQLLLSDQQLSARQARGLAVIQQSGQHLLTLISDILDLARIDAGKLELNIGTIMLPLFVSTVADIIRVKADEKKLLFVYRPITQPLAVLGDELRLRQVLLNMLSNAVKFTDQGQVGLRVTTLGYEDTSPERMNVRLRFEVSDSGIGMAPDQMERLFQPFEQLAESRRREGGAGLGLAISRRLVHRMGGNIEVHSELGKGSVFAFELSLPVTASEIGQAPIAQEDRINGYEGPRRTILLADDVAPNLAMLVDTLSALGFNLQKAANGQEVLERVRERTPDLILMDVSMPLMDGLEATRRLRLNPELARLPIVITSASASHEVDAGSRAAGADDFIPKPIDRRVLLQVLAGHLNLRWTLEARVAPSMPAPPAMAIPPLHEMLALLGLARIGNMRDIREHALHLRTQDPRYDAFCKRVGDLAATYESQAIVSLIESLCED